MRWTILLVKILIIGALLIAANLNLDINNPSDRGILFSEFYSWLDSLYQESLGFVGYVAKSEWLPEQQPLNQEEEENK